ncbi:MAG: class I SAM-dependent methyltransferase [Corynebacterium sp.]|nr:class I SAM-dependent methyltransferase [Corynebacterium sp.]
MAHIPPISRQHQPNFRNAAQRQATAAAYEQDIAAYDAVRPGYPQAFVLALAECMQSLPLESRCVVDVGCGTGKLSMLLQQEFADALIVGVDPSAAMLQEAARNFAESSAVWVRGDAHQLPLAAGVADVVACAQAWHWFDSTRASAQAARVAAPDGVLALAWNTLDVRVPWVHRLTRITHAGDTLAAGFYPVVAPPWDLVREVRLEWEQQLAVPDIFRLMHTRSYWLRANEKTRAKMTANLQWYLHEHLGFNRNEVVSLPYRFDGFVYRQSDAGIGRAG